VHFNLTRWFAIAALLTIGLLAVVAGTLLNQFITQRLLWQQAQLTAEFVQSLVLADKSLQRYIADPSVGLDPQTEEAFGQVVRLPDMLRANIYDPSRRMIWSTDRSLIGRRFGPNEELDEALTGKVVTSDIEDEEAKAAPVKAEHTGLQAPESKFVEIYVPVVAQLGGKALAVIEFYKSTRPLAAALAELRRNIVIGATACGALLFLALFGLVRRAHLTIRNQQRQLVENETLAVIGEMGTAVAHGLRNPLASIRSSAELIQGGSLDEAYRASADIVAQSDRLEAWVSELLAYIRPLDEASAAVPLQPLVARCVEDFDREAKRRSIELRAVVDPGLPAVRGNALLLGQVLGSVLANAFEALDKPGRITVRSEWERGDKMVTLAVEDSGPGMSRAQLMRAGKPFHTTKTRGMGVGLALARRIMERHGGRLVIDSTPGQGTTVRLRMQTA
jgi:signal transduction histidine kinase